MPIHEPDAHPIHEPDAVPQEAPVSKHLTPWQRMAALGRLIRDRANPKKAARAQAAIDAAKAIPAVTKPAPPKVPTAPHGFMPGATVENIVPGVNDPAIIPCGVVFHVAVSLSADIRPIFTDGRGLESHFYVRLDGTVLQYRSIFFEADAQFAGNSFGSPRKGFVSIETEGMGDGLWTAAQLATLKAITLWVKTQADFPLRVCPAWDQPGVGYHSLFTQWNTDAHSCPGPNRILQFRRVLVPSLVTP